MAFRDLEKTTPAAGAELSLARDATAMLALFLVAVGLRLAWVLAVDVDPARGGFHYDMLWYHLAAGQIAEGNGLTRYDGAATAVWPPAYPALLGGIYFLTGGSVLVAQIVNALLGGLACLFTCLLGRRLFGSGVGMLAGLLFAAFPGDIFFTPMILSEILFETVLTGAVLLFAVWHSRDDGPGLSRWFAFGMLIGTASLIRGIAVAFLLVPLAVWLLSSRSPRTSLLKTCVAGLGLVCVIAPWTARNYVKLGYPVLIATSIGRTLGHAHSETSGPTVAALAKRQAFERQFAHLPDPEREIETMKAWQQMTIRYMWTHPWEELRAIPTRFYHLYKHGHEGFLWGRDKLESGGGLRPVFGPGVDRAICIGADSYYFAVAALALLGLLQTLTAADRARLLLPLSVLYFTALHSVLFPGNPRYHSAVIPFLCIAAAAALATARARIRGEPRPLCP
jgi:hypothetical protein